MKSFRSSLLVAAALMSASIAGAGMELTNRMAPPVAMQLQQHRKAQRLGGGLVATAWHRYPSGPGWTHAHHARQKTKRRGVALNKARHRAAARRAH